MLFIIANLFRRDTLTLDVDVSIELVVGGGNQHLQPLEAVLEGLVARGNDLAQLHKLVDLAVDEAIRGARNRATGAVHAHIHVLKLLELLHLLELLELLNLLLDLLHVHVAHGKTTGALALDV